MSFNLVAVASERRQQQPSSQWHRRQNRSFISFILFYLRFCLCLCVREHLSCAVYFDCCRYFVCQWHSAPTTQPPSYNKVWNCALEFIVVCASNRSVISTEECIVRWANSASTCKCVLASRSAHNCLSQHRKRNRQHTRTLSAADFIFLILFSSAGERLIHRQKTE